MFGSFKRFFTKSAPKRQDVPGSDPAGSPPVDAPDASAEAAAQDSQDYNWSATPENSDSVTLPFSSIVKHVPKELRGKAGAATAGGSFSLSKSQILEQLGQGSVK